MSGRCKTCKWFDVRNWHSCQCPKMVYGYGMPDADLDGMNVENDEGWGFIPGPEFGCIHQEDKE